MCHIIFGFMQSRQLEQDRPVEYGAVMVSTIDGYEGMAIFAVFQILPFLVNLVLLELSLLWPLPRAMLAL